jgi:PRTRC genetic system protein C
MKVSTPSKRVLKYKDQELPDLNPSVPMEAVMRLYATTGQYPELATAALGGPIVKDGIAVYTVETRLGSKG